MFSHANGHKGAECHPAIDCPKHLVPVVAMVVAGSGERVSCRLFTSICVTLARDVGILLDRPSSEN